MDSIKLFYDDQSKKIENLAKQSFDNALEYIETQINLYGKLAYGLLDSLIEISTDEQIDQIIKKFSKLPYLQKLNVSKLASDLHFYKQKYQNITESICKLTKEVDCVTKKFNFVSLPKFIKNGNFDKVVELLNSGESPYTRIDDMHLLHYLSKFNNIKMTEIISNHIKRIDNQQNMVTIDAYIEKVNSHQYSDVDKLIYTFQAFPFCEDQININKIVEISDNRIIEILQSEFDQIRKFLLKSSDELIKYKKYDILFSKELKDMEYYKKRLLLSNCIITNKDLKAISNCNPSLFNFNDIVNNGIVDLLQKIEDSSITESPSISLSTEVFYGVPLGNLIGRLANLDTVKVLCQNYSTADIEMLVLGAALGDKMDSFKYLISLPVNFKGSEILNLLLAAKRYEYAKILTEMHSEVALQKDNDFGLPNFWEFAKDLPVNHPLIIAMIPAIAKLIKEAPLEVIKANIAQIKYRTNIPALVSSCFYYGRYDVVKFLDESTNIQSYIGDYMHNISVDWNQTSEIHYLFEKHFLKYQDQQMLMSIACKNGSKEQLQILLKHDKNEYIFRNSIIQLIIEMLESRTISLLFEFVVPYVKDQIIWVIGAADHSIFQTMYEEHKGNITKSQKILMAMFAIYFNQIENLKDLLNDGLNPNDKANIPQKNEIITYSTIGQHISEFLITFAIKWSNVEFVKTLIEAGADYTSRNNSGETSLLYAIELGKLEIADYLLQLRGIINREELGKLLEASCMVGCMNYARNFIEMGADPKNHPECLSKAARGPHAAIAKMLLEKGCPPTNDALEFACESNCASIVDLLFQYGLKIDIFRKTIKSIPVAEAFIKYGIKVDLSKQVMEAHGCQVTPAFPVLLAAGNDPTSAAFKLLNCGSAKVPDLLLSAMLKCNLNPNAGFREPYLLQIACRYNHLSTVKMLVEHGANINAPPNTKFNITPLNAACQVQNNRDIVAYLIEHGAEAVPLGDKPTSLLSAASNGYTDLVLPKCIGKPISDSFMLASISRILLEKNELEFAVQVVELFKSTNYAKKDLTVISSNCTDKNIDEDIRFTFTKRIIQLGISFHNIEIRHVTSRDIAGLMIESGATLAEYIKPLIELGTNMCTSIYFPWGGDSFIPVTKRMQLNCNNSEGVRYGQKPRYWPIANTNRH